MEGVEKKKKINYGKKVYGSRLKQLMEESNIGVKALSEALDVTSHMVFDWMCKEQFTLKQNLTEKMCAILNINETALLLPYQPPDAPFRDHYTLEEAQKKAKKERVHYGISVARERMRQADQEWKKQRAEKMRV